MSENDQSAPKWVAPAPMGTPGSATQTAPEWPPLQMPQSSSLAPAQGLGPQGKLRHPMGVWIYSIITFGIYFCVVHYKMNRELRDFSTTIKVNPTLSVLALFIPFGGLVTGITTIGRIRQAQALVGLAPTASPVLWFFSNFVGMGVAYTQGQLDLVWHQMGQTYDNRVA